MAESDIVDEFKKGCLMLEGELTESKSLVKCDFDGIKITLKKDGEWIKCYSDGKLKVWCRPEEIIAARDTLARLKLMSIDLKDCEIPKITLGIEQDHPCLMYVSPIDLVRPEGPPFVAEEFLREYAEKARRAFIASRSRIGRRR